LPPAERTKKNNALIWWTGAEVLVSILFFDVGRMAILGLALSGHLEAAETLRSLQRPVITEGDRKFQTQVGAVISEALSAHETISREGLVSYDRRGRRR